MNRKELKIYVIGAVIFFILRILLGLVMLILAHNFSCDFINKLTGIYDLLFMYFIFGNVSNSYMAFVLIFTYSFLLGGMLSLIISYNYYVQKKIKKREIVNPVSKKSLFIAIAVFVGFVLLVRVIAWLGGF